MCDPGHAAGGRVAAAARVLRLAATAAVQPETARPEDLRAAIAILGQSPPEPHWDRDLLLGMRLPDPGLIQFTAETCRERLERYPDPAWQDRFLGDILDTCWFYLAPHGNAAVTGSRAELPTLGELAATQLFGALCRLLDANPLALDHHRARILGWAWKVRHHGGTGGFVRAVLDFQERLGEDTGRADGRTARQLHLARRDAAYASADTGEQVLLAYLNQDRDLPAAEIPTQLLVQYARLLAVQTRGHARRAIILALDNLTRWLATRIDLQGPSRESLVTQSFEYAGRGVVAADLNGEGAADLLFHVEAHRALLPGPGRPDDLLTQLRERYDALGSEDIVIAGLKLLARLPLVRARADEVAALISNPGSRRRGLEAWMATFDLVEALLTGLHDFALSAAALESRAERRNRLRRTMTAQDRVLRGLLLRIATGRDPNLPVEPGMAALIRERAWRSLLRSLPPNLRTLYWRGLRADGGRLLAATLEEARDAGQRVLWDLLRRDWPAWLAPATAADAQARRVRLALVVDYWRETRVYAGVDNDGESLGPILSLALDDTDTAVRADAEQAVIGAGFDRELARERQKRRLGWLVDESTACQQRVIALQQERDELVRRINHARLERAERALTIQRLQQEREHLISAGYVDTADLQVENLDLRERLARALREANDALGVIDGLRQRIATQVDEEARFYRQATDLVQRQRSCESEAARLGSRARDLANELEAARRRQHEAAAEAGRLASREPRVPRFHGDQDQQQRQREEFARAHAAWQRQLSRAQAQARETGHACDTGGRELSECRVREQQEQKQLERLTDDISRIRHQVGTIQSRIDTLSGDLRGHQQGWETLRRQIAALREQAAGLERRMRGMQEALARAIGENTRGQQHEQQALDALVAVLEQRSTLLNGTLDRLQREETRAQELLQAIASGRHEYDALALAAGRQSPASDQEGRAAEAATLQRVRADQEALVLYAHGLAGAVENHPPPPLDPRLRVSARSGKQRSRQ